MNLYIVLGVFILFLAAIFSGKVKVHVAAMMIPVLLEVTGVLKFADAWAGLSNSSVVMMASMFVLGAALSKTNLISSLSKTVIKPDSSDRRILIGLAIPLIFLSCFVNAATTIAILIPIVRQVCIEQKRPMSKFFQPLGALCMIWAGAIPTGGNAGSYLADNTIIKNLGGVGTYTFFTNLTAKIPYLIVLTLFIIIFYPKFTPDNGDIPVHTPVTEGGKKGKSSALSKGQEYFVMTIFALTIVGIIICAFTGISTWYASTVGAIIVCFSGILSDREAIKAATSPIIFITVGTLPLSTALKVSGGDKLIVDGFKAVTGNMGPLGTMLVMYFIVFILTQFLVNSSVSNSFKTIAAAIAVQSGYDARALMLAVTHGSTNDYATSFGSPAMTVAYEEGSYTPIQFLKLGIPISIVQFILFVLYIPTVFPLIPVA